MSIDARRFADRYGPWALIAGGSEGIGKSFARQVAGFGINLVLVSRGAAALEETAEEIAGDFGVEVKTCALDLTAPDLDREIEPVIAGLDVGLLVYNAGATHGAGLFLDEPVDKALNLVRLNCVGPLLLTHKLGRRMKARGHGGIILMSSMSSLAGGGFVATYAATKSFEVVLAEALWFELGCFDIDVLALIAGATETPAMQRSGATFGDSHKTGAAEPGTAQPNLVAMHADDVAREGLEHLGHGPTWIAGAKNREAAAGLRQAPREDVIRAMSAAAASLYRLPFPPGR